MGRIKLNKVHTLDGKEFSMRTALPQDAERIIAYNKAIMDEALYLVTRVEGSIRYGRKRQ